MNLTTRQYLVLESIFTNATITLGEIDNYYHLIEVMKEAQQIDSNTIEVNFDFEDLQLFHKFILVSDFKVSDINFVIELLGLLGLIDLVKPSIKRLRSVFMWSNYKYVGSKELSIIVKGICVTIMPGDRIKKFFLPFFLKQYKEDLQVIDEPVVTPSIEVATPTLTVDTIVEQPEVEELVPTPIIEEGIDEPIAKEVKQEKSYPYIFKGKALNNILDVKMLLKEELQTLAIELGLSSDAKVKQLRDKINTCLLKKR